MKPAEINDTVITFCGKKRRVVCDRRCCKAWGRDIRTHEILEGDDFAYLSDHELGVAPVDPGTYEATDAKPKSPDDFPNEWCVRQCERCTMAELGVPVAIKTFEQRVYNKDRGEPQKTIWFVGDEIAVEHLCVQENGVVLPALIMLSVFTDGENDHVQCPKCGAVWDADSERCILASSNIPKQDNCLEMSTQQQTDPPLTVAEQLKRNDCPVYLAVPYMHDSSLVREYRFNAANKAAATLINEGYVVFSPISHSHPIAVDGNIQGLGWETWERQDIAMLRLCKALFVLQLDGWDQSLGVQAEIKEAKRMGIPIYYLAA